MSRLGRLLPSIAAARRPYSIFSSKPGGGRYFNSAKPPKVIASTTSKANPSTSASTSNAGTPAKPEATDGKITEDLSSSSQQPTVPDARRLFAPANAFSSAAPPLSDFTPLPPHPTLKPNELTLHRFFALHRPCLLLNQPTSALFESVPPLPSTPSTFAAPPASLGTIDDPPVASPEADAEAARQLSRTLVMNRVGNTVDWEGALARLGLHEVKEPTLPVPSGISMDSTKRKRRKKMKKHKLKKRRRLSRATRLRLGK